MSQLNNPAPSCSAQHGLDIAAPDSMLRLSPASLWIIALAIVVLCTLPTFLMQTVINTTSYSWAHENFFHMLEWMCFFCAIFTGIFAFIYSRITGDLLAVWVGMACLASGGVEVVDSLVRHDSFIFTSISYQPAFLSHFALASLLAVCGLLTLTVPVNVKHRAGLQVALCLLFLSTLIMLYIFSPPIAPIYQSAGALACYLLAAIWTCKKLYFENPTPFRLGVWLSLIPLAFSQLYFIMALRTQHVAFSLIMGHCLNVGGYLAIFGFLCHDFMTQIYASKEQAALTGGLPTDKKDFHQLIHTIVNSSHDGMVTISPQGLILDFNPAAENIFECHCADIIGQPITQLLPSLKLEFFAKIFGTNHRPQPVEHFQARGRRATGEEFPIEIALTTLVLRQQSMLFCAIRDLTPNREISQLKSRLLSSVSHELRTPLTSIKGFTATLLQDDGIDTQLRGEFLSIVDQEADRLTAMIENLLELSTQQQTIAPTLAIEPTNLNDAIQQTVEIFRAKLDEKSLALDMVLDTTAPMVQAEKSSLIRVLFNLMDNAVKFTPQGGAIRLVSCADQTNVYLQIIDNGVGIPATEKELVFEPFYRHDASGQDCNGAGLGLTITRNLMTRMGASISVANAQPQGTIFNLTFKQAKQLQCPA